MNAFIFKTLKIGKQFCNVLLMKCCDSLDAGGSNRTEEQKTNDKWDMKDKRDFETTEKIVVFDLFSPCVG